MTELEQIEELLWKEWDPIGINDLSSNTDEYDRYAYRIIEMLHYGTDEKSIARYLERMVTINMGLKRSENHDEVASLIIRYHGRTK